MSDSMTALITAERSQIRAIGKKYKIGGLVVLLIGILIVGVIVLLTPPPYIVGVLIVYWLITTSFAMIMIRIGLVIGESALHMRHHKRWSASVWPFVVTLHAPEIIHNSHTGVYKLHAPAHVNLSLKKILSVYN